MNQEETQPKRTDVFPDNEEYNYEDDEDRGPGCLIWGVMGVFGITVSIAIVALAALSGFNQGIETGQTTAVAVTEQYIQAECSQLPTDIAMSRIQIVQQRYDKWEASGGIPACAQSFVPQATQIYEQSIITDTPMPTATATATATAIPQDTAIPTATSPQTTGGYDLESLLTEAQSYLNESNYQEAIRTLDAIAAIDPNFRSEQINSLLFNALRQRATLLYQSPEGSLAEAILVTNRAEQFGDVGELNFERSVAQLYLDAQAYVDVNYSSAIVLLSQVIGLSPNYPRGTGQARQQLLKQYEGYGDAFVFGGEPCRAVQQYNSSLQLSPNQVAVQTKRDDAQTQCSLGLSSSTTDPNATLDPNLTPSPAPVGVGG